MMRRRVGAALGCVAAVALLSGCTTNGINAAGTPIATASATTSPTPAASATPLPTLADCPTLPTAAPLAGGLPVTDLQCLGPGPSVNLANLRGTPSVVNVWASWCLPCRAETPALVGAHKALGAKVQFMGVDIQDEAGAAQRFMTTFGVTYPSAFDPKATVRAPLRVLGPPVTYFVDAHGVIVKRVDGGLGSTAAVLDEVKQQFGITP